MSYYIHERISHFFRWDNARVVSSPTSYVFIQLLILFPVVTMRTSCQVPLHRYIYSYWYCIGHVSWPACSLWFPPHMLYIHSLTTTYVYIQVLILHSVRVLTGVLYLNPTTYIKHPFINITLPQRRAIFESIFLYPHYEYCNASVSPFTNFSHATAQLTGVLYFSVSP